MDERMSEQLNGKISMYKLIGKTVAELGAKDGGDKAIEAAIARMAERYRISLNTAQKAYAHDGVRKAIRLSASAANAK